MRLDDIGVPVESIPYQDDWNDEGVVCLPGLLADHDDLMTAYERVWLACNVGRPGGWPDPIPYRRHPEILDLLTPIATPVAETLHDPAGVHLNLTGWVSTQRAWHADQYLNPEYVGDRYTAIWIALEDIHPDSGPFQYVPGSHRWPQITREIIWEMLDGYQGPDWPSRSEEVLTSMYANEIELRDAEVVTYLPKRGDVLLWHSRLLHQGSMPKVPGMQRKALIAHMSRWDARPDMPTPRRHEDGPLLYFPIGASRAAD